MMEEKKAEGDTKRLKTLKDFEYGGLDGAELLKDGLREEAKKWIKTLNIPSREASDLFGYDNEGIIAWIKHFFNITEDELKK